MESSSAFESMFSTQDSGVDSLDCSGSSSGSLLESDDMSIILGVAWVFPRGEYALFIAHEFSHLVFSTVIAENEIILGTGRRLWCAKSLLAQCQVSTHHSVTKSVVVWIFGDEGRSAEGIVVNCVISAFLKNYSPTAFGS